MIRGDDLNLGFLFSYIGPEEVLDKVARERVVRECDLTPTEILKFRKKANPWVNGGMINKTMGRNPDYPIEEILYYFLTDLGKEYYNNLNPTH